MLTCDIILDQYYREHIAVRAVARKRTENCIEALSFFNGTPVGAIDIPLCRRYRNEHRAYMSDSTVRRELGVLQAAINHAARWRRLKGIEQMPSIELPPEGDSSAMWLTKEETGLLLEAAAVVDARAYRFVQLAYHTAARKASIECLTWDRIDLKTRRIDLKPQGKKQTKKRQPIVPISENIAAALAEAKSSATNQWVLGTNRDIRRAFDKAASAAGLSMLPAMGLRPEGLLTPHVLRHSRATHLLQDGKSPWAVAQLLGDTLETVLRIYGHSCPDYLESVLS